MPHAGLVIQGCFPHGIHHPSQLRQCRTAPGAQPIGNAVQLPPHVAPVLTHGGQPLPPEVRQLMERVFGQDLGDVRIHVGPQPLGATSITCGLHIHFAPGHYAPATTRGRQALGRELAHVIQQRTGRVRNPFGSGIAIVQDRLLEAEAERYAVRAVLQNALMTPPPIQCSKQQPPGNNNAWKITWNTNPNTNSPPKSTTSNNNANTRNTNNANTRNTNTRNTTSPTNNANIRLDLGFCNAWNRPLGGSSTKKTQAEEWPDLAGNTNTEPNITFETKSEREKWEEAPPEQLRRNTNAGNPEIERLKGQVKNWDQTEHAGARTKLTWKGLEPLVEWAEKQKTPRGRQKFTIQWGEGTGEYAGKDQLKIIGRRVLGDKNATFHISYRQ